MTYRCAETRLEDAAVLRVVRVGAADRLLGFGYQADLSVAVSVIAGSPRTPL